MTNNKKKIWAYEANQHYLLGKKEGYQKGYEAGYLKGIKDERSLKSRNPPIITIRGEKHGNYKHIRLSQGDNL